MAAKLGLKSGGLNSMMKQNMLKFKLPAKKKPAFFTCQVTESHIKVAKFFSADRSSELAGIEFQPLVIGADDIEIAGKMSQSLKRQGYTNNTVIISLPRSLATCRNLKVPSRDPQEIEKITSLQASHYLPYPANELITAYQIISGDKEGYSNTSLIIVHRNIIEKYMKICGELKSSGLNIVLGSYGLLNLYNRLKPRSADTVLVIDIDALCVELAVISAGKLSFSRSFKLNHNNDWAGLFLSEIRKTQDAYLKEVGGELPSKIIIVGAAKVSAGCAQALEGQVKIPIEVLSYKQDLKLSDAVLPVALDSDNSFASVIGLGLEDIEGSLSLLPPDIKDEAKKSAQKGMYLRRVLFIAGIILIWVLAIARNLDNKQRYLEKLKTELAKISKEARPLEEIDKRLKFMQERLQKKPSSLDIVYELHRIAPAEVAVVNFSYDEDAQAVILRGQSQELNAVFNFARELEKSAVFKSFNIKVRYATKKKTVAGEITDFEVSCTKK